MKLARPARQAQTVMPKSMANHYRIQTILITGEPKTLNFKSVQKLERVRSLSWIPANFIYSFFLSCFPFFGELLFFSAQGDSGGAINHVASPFQL